MMIIVEFLAILFTTFLLSIPVWILFPAIPFLYIWAEVIVGMALLLLIANLL